MDSKKIIMEWVAAKIADGRLTTFSLNELIWDVHISKKTIYKHFASKQDLIDQVLTQYLRTLEHEVIQITTKELSATDRILKIQMDVFVALKEFFPTSWKTIDAAYKSNDRINPLELFFHQFLHRIIKELLIEGIINEEFDHISELDLITRKILFDLYGVLEFAQEEVKQQGKQKIFYLYSGLLLKGLTRQVPAASNTSN